MSYHRPNHWPTVVELLDRAGDSVRCDKCRTWFGKAAYDEHLSKCDGVFRFGCRQCRLFRVWGRAKIMQHMISQHGRYDWDVLYAMKPMMVRFDEKKTTPLDGT